MKPRFLQTAFILLGILGLALGVHFVMTMLPAFDDGSLGLSGREPSISELASSYTGTLTRPLLPKVSLFLPTVVQAIISLGLVIGMVFIAKFMPKARQAVILLTIATVSRHILWRGMETLDTSSVVATAIGVIIYTAEILAFCSMVLGYFQIWGQTDRKSISIANIPPEQLPSVDVFICTYNEPVSVLYRSLVGALSIEYPKKKVFLLDDGNRPEMAELAQKLGANYISRAENIHAKAGNLNNALTQTTGDLVLVFDADHVSCKTFLNEVVGFFSDPKLAFVQTPQHFFTPDPFQRNLVAEEVVTNEQDLFFHVIEPGNDYWGATFFAGSGAIFRRDSLNQIGGFAVETITEDVHTGLRLHAKGWKSLYYNRDLAAGLAQDSFADFIKQRLRWARGMTQILFFDHPLLTWGLSLPQRLCYFAGIWYFFVGLPRFIFLVAPLCFLIFGYKTINAGFLEVLIYYVPSFVCLFFGYTVVSRGVRHSFWSEVYETAVCVYLMLTNFATILSPKRAKFRVTPKGTMTDRLNFNWQVVFPQMLVASLIIVGIVMAVVRAIYTPEYAGGIYTNLFWSLYNVALLLAAIYVAQERPQLRISPRIFKRIRCELRLIDGSIAVGYTTNISESGVAIVFDQPIPITGTLSLKLLDWDINETTVLSVQAMRSSVSKDGKYYVGFRVVNRTDQQHQKLIRHMFGSAEVWSDDHCFSKPTQSFAKLLSLPLRLINTVENATKRRTVRFSAALPCAIEVDGQYYVGTTNEISETGLSMFLKEGRVLYIGQTADLRIQWANGTVSNFTAQVMRNEQAPGGQYKLGFNFSNLTREQRVELIRQIYNPGDNLVRIAPKVDKTVPCLITSKSGANVKGFTKEISEMGVIVSLSDTSQLPKGNESVQIELQWEDHTTSTVPGTIVEMVDGYGNQSPMALLCFHNVDMKTLDAISQKIHEPIESKTFHSLNAM